jgi:glycosyltransferase involved in cell wall biosynthesis
MNIVHVPRRFTRSRWGGTETVILETCARLNAMGHQSRIVCPNALASENHEVIRGVRVDRAPYFYPYFGLSRDAKKLLDLKGGNLFSFSLMRTLMRVPDLDLIHLHTAKRTGGIGRFVAMKRNIPYVISLHGGVYDVPADEAATWTEPTKGAWEWGKILGWWVGSRRVLEDAACILCVGEEERIQTQKRFPQKRVIHLPNGVDPVRFANGDGDAFRKRHRIPADAYVALNVGRIDPQKNQLWFVTLLPDLMKVIPNIHVLIIGPVTNEYYYRKLLASVRDLGLEHRATVVPGLDAEGNELADAYHSADVFVLPSIHEPFGIVILEAWASGLPVVASRIGGIPSFAEHGRDALLFEPNHADALIAALRSIAESEDFSNKLATAGRAKARDQYSWDAITARLARLYEEVIRENTLRK